MNWIERWDQVELRKICVAEGEGQEPGAGTGTEGKCPGDRKAGEEMDRNGSGACLGLCEELENHQAGKQGDRSRSLGQEGAQVLSLSHSWKGWLAEAPKQWPKLPFHQSRMP